MHFVDAQLAVPDAHCLLMCKFFPMVPRPYRDFYRDGLVALRTIGFETADESARTRIVETLWKG